MQNSPVDSPDTPPGAVFDCNVFLQAAVRDTGPAFACLELAEAGKVRLYISTGILSEIQDVLTRPKTQRKFPALTAEYVDQFLLRIAMVAVLLEEIPAVFSHPRDPKDELYLNLAITVDARFLVSRDRDLLDLMNKGTEKGRAFLHRFPDLAILDPVGFLRSVTPVAPSDPTPE